MRSSDAKRDRILGARVGRGTQRHGRQAPPPALQVRQGCTELARAHQYRTEIAISMGCGPQKMMGTTRQPDSRRCLRRHRESERSWILVEVDLHLSHVYRAERCVPHGVGSSLRLNQRPATSLACRPPSFTTSIPSLERMSVTTPALPFYQAVLRAA